MPTTPGKTGKKRVKGAVKKRVSVSANGQRLTAKKPCKNHLLLQKSARQKQLGSKKMLLCPGDAAPMRKMLGLS